MPTTVGNTRTRVAVALHQANAELRAKTVGDKQHHRNIFCDVIEQSEYPSLTLAETVRRLGRHRSLNVGIDPSTIEAAISEPKIFEGRL